MVGVPEPTGTLSSYQRAASRSPPEAVPLDGVYTRPDGQTEPGRMGMCWTVGKGKVFYFTPGHETYNDYYRPEVRQIFVNAVPWAANK